jgi:AcrR family transcriptional regulator
VTRRRLPAAQRRERVHAAASDLFAARGYAATSIDQIAAAAGVTAPVIYDHAGSKRELYMDLLRAHAARLVEATTRVDPGDTMEDALRANTEAFFAFVEEHPAAWRMLFGDPAPDAEIAALQREIQAAATARLAEVLVGHARQLSLSVDLRRAQADEMVAELGKSALNGLAGWWWEHRDVPRAAVTAVALDVLWTGLARLTGYNGGP